MPQKKKQQLPEKMINRILLRIKIVQLLYAYQKNQSKSVDLAEKELFKSIEKTYTLYHLFLLLINEITAFAQNRIAVGKKKLRPTTEELNPNTRFADNLFAKQLAGNESLKAFIEEHKVSWENHPTFIKNCYESILNSDFYAEYMEQESTSYETDKELWRKIVKKCILPNEELYTTLEEICIYWNDDIDIVISFVLKTIKRFDPTKGNQQELLPMFKDDEDSAFASTLFNNTILHLEEYKALIDTHTKNWEVDRIAFMDIVIMQIALAELLHFPTIPINVTLNEYIEIAKKYSTDKSGTFVNGVLDTIITQLKKENKLIKAKIITTKQK